jgi:rRNA-processing protein FCF1
MRIVFDTNFIMTCIKQKIDFIYELEGHELLLPKQVIKELEKIVEDKKKKFEERELARTSLMFIKSFRNRFKEIELERKFVDRGLERLEGVDIIATLDKALHKKLRGKFKFLVVTKRKKLEIIN